MSRYIWPNGAPDRAAHRATLLERMLGDWPEIGGYWVAKWRDRPGFLGWCGLFPLEDSGLVEIGCRYCQRAWGQGLAARPPPCSTTVFGNSPSTPSSPSPIPGTAPRSGSSPRSAWWRPAPPLHYGQDLSFFRLGRDRYLRRGSRPAPPCASCLLQAGTESLIQSEIP